MSNTNTSIALSTAKLISVKPSASGSKLTCINEKLGRVKVTTFADFNL